MSDKRDKILKTALHLFVSQGLQQTPMAQLSKESGVAVGTMYHHFKSKDELINALFLDIQEEFGRSILMSEKDKKLSYQERFKILWNKSYNYYVSNPDKFIFAHTHIYSPLISNDIRTEARKSYAEAIKFIQEVKEAGIFVQTHLVVLMRWYYLSVAALVQIHIANEIKITKKIKETAINMAWNAMVDK